MNTIFKSKKGVFLTLGITFVSILVLTLASLILRNAETSEERISELGAFERFYVTDESIRETYYSMLRDIMNFTIEVNATNLSTVRFRHEMPYLGIPGRDKRLTMFTNARLLLFLLYGGLLTKDFAVKSIFDEIRLSIRPAGISYAYYFNEGNGSGGLGSNPNNTHVVFITKINYDPNKIVPNLTALTFIMKYNESLPGYNGTINWITYNAGPCCRTNLTFVLLGPNGYKVSDSRMAYFKNVDAQLSGRIEIGNLTGATIPAFFMGTYVNDGAMIFLNGNNQFDIVETIMTFNSTGASEKVKVYSQDEMNISFNEFGLSKQGPIRLG